MTQLSISLSPSGGLRLQLPGRRTLDIEITTNEKIVCGCCGEAQRVPVTPAGLRAIKRILHDADSGTRDQPGYIGQFPTQAVVDAWLKADARDKEADALARDRAAVDAMGIDLEKVEFEL